MNNPLLDSFAEAVINRMDEAIEKVELAACRYSRVPKGLESLQAELATLDPKCLEVLRKCTAMVAADVLTHTLYTVFEFADAGEWEIRVGGQELSKLTPGLHQEIWGDEGWLHRFGKHANQ